MSDTNAATGAAAPATSRVIHDRVDLPLANGTALSGRLEYFPSGKTLVVFDRLDDLLAQTLTVKAVDAPEAHANLGPDEVLLRNWTEFRGAAAALADQGIVELTGVEVAVSTFRLQALVARVL